MAYRFSNTEKWSDAWFYDLSSNEKLLFLYLCDNCDIGGFVEINLRKWSSDTRIKESEIKASLKGLQRGLVYSQEGDYIYLKNFLKHQKNLPLNSNNKAHQGILRRFEEKAQKFNIENIIDFINSPYQAPLKGLQRGTGNGNGNGIGNGNSNSNIIENKTINKDLELINKIGVSFEFKDVFLKWLKYKRDKNQTYKSKESVQLAYKKLISLSNNDLKTANDIVEQSMANNWAGLFELKTDFKPTKPKSSGSNWD